MAVSSGLKRSQRVSKYHETLGAEHICASHMVSQCRESLGAERVRALHEVSNCHETLSAERARVSASRQDTYLMNSRVVSGRGANCAGQSPAFSLRSVN